jgi:hypothetical protein
MAFITGKYSATYDNGSGPREVGQIAAGFTLEHVVSKQLITGDNEGDSAQSAVYRGHNVFTDFTMMEYVSQDVGLGNGDGGSVNIFLPYTGTEVPNLLQGVIGRLDSVLDSSGDPATGSVAGDLVLTALTGTPAAGQGTSTDGPASLTARVAILAEDFPVRMLFGVGLREIPVRMRFYPNNQPTEFYTVA